MEKWKREREEGGQEGGEAEKDIERGRERGQREERKGGEKGSERKVERVRREEGGGKEKKHTNITQVLAIACLSLKKRLYKLGSDLVVSKAELDHTKQEFI